MALELDESEENVSVTLSYLEKMDSWNWSQVMNIFSLKF